MQVFQLVARVITVDVIPIVVRDPRRLTPFFSAPKGTMPHYLQLETRKI